MKLWQSILLTIFIGVLFIVATSFLLEKQIQSVAYIFLLIFAIWVYIDARKYDTKKYKSFFGLHPLVLALGTYFLWFITFPAYLWLRYRIKNNLLPIREKYKNNNQSQNSQPTQ